MASFVLHIAEIHEAGGRKQFELPIPPEWLSEAFEGLEFNAGDESGTVKVDARLLGDDLLLNVDYTAAFSAVCARCNGDVPLSQKHSFSQLMLPTSKKVDLPEELELTPEDLERDYYAGESVSIDALLREHLLLEVPMRPVCPGECVNQDVAQHVATEPSEKLGENPLASLLNLKDKL